MAIIVLPCAGPVMAKPGVHRIESPVQEAPPEHFTGKAHVSARFQSEAPARVGGGTVTFQPGAHTDWHSHPLGQTLIVTHGHGFVQEWQHPARAIAPGDTVWIGPGVKHWHGAGPHAGMTHVAIAERLNGQTVTWMEKVSAADYAAATAHPR